MLLDYAVGPIQDFKSASTAYTKPENQVVLQRIKNDNKLEVYAIIYDTSAKDCVRDLCRDILKLGKGLKITDDLTEATISKAFDFFDMYVLDSKLAKGKTSREKVAMFIGIFFSDEFRETTSGRGNTSINCVNIGNIDIKVNSDYYNKFKLLYSIRDYSRLEQKQITAITDRLLEDTDRRRKGDFYTPTIWVDEAHKLLDKNLGANWRNEYIVWDCAWGTGNLTRDYQFANLYCSTINNEELNIGARYNKNATKFQYDFLNDDVEEFEQARNALRTPFRFKQGINVSQMEQYINFKDILDLYAMAVEKGIITQEEGQLAYRQAVNILRSTKLYKYAPDLVDSIINGGEQGKKLLFFINPPYKGAGSGHGNTNTSDVVDTTISDVMKSEGVSGTGQLYVQFLYRIMSIYKEFGVETSIGIFTPSQILNAITLKDIRDIMIKGIGYSNGFMIQASNFANVAPGWSISFTVWGGKTKSQETKLDIMDITDNGVDTIQTGKIIKMLTKEEKALEWIKEPKNKQRNTLPRFTSAINYTENKVYEREHGALGTLIMDMGIVESNQQRVAIMNARSNANWTIIDITENNFYKIMPFFAARRLIDSNWINSKDEYIVPNLGHKGYNMFWADSIIYTIFNNALNISSLRNIGKSNNYTLYNQFFWISKDYISKLAGGTFSKDDINTDVEDDLEYDVRVNMDGFKYPYGDKIDIQGYKNTERYVYILLSIIDAGYMDGVTLSSEANAVLSKATQLVKDSFKYRKAFNQLHPEYHINTWDAGWYQIKGLLKEYMPNELKEFNSLYKALEDRMRPLVYELGFLYK